MFGLKLALPRWFSWGKTSTAASEASALDAPPAPGLAPIASAVVLAAGAGVAFWWWTQWARGRAESELVDTENAEPDVKSPQDEA